MVRCASCGKNVSADPDGTCIKSKGSVYHISCAPAPLLAAAVEEWDAIMARGIEYFVGKYTLADSRRKPHNTMLLKRFAKVGEKLKAEVEVRGANAE